MALVTIGTRRSAPRRRRPPAARSTGSPGSPALLCIRPHALRLVGLGERGCAAGHVNAAVGGERDPRGAVGRRSARPVIEVDVPGQRSRARSRHGDGARPPEAWPRADGGHEHGAPRHRRRDCRRRPGAGHPRRSVLLCRRRSSCFFAGVLPAGPRYKSPGIDESRPRRGPGTWTSGLPPMIFRDCSGRDGRRSGSPRPRVPVLGTFLVLCWHSCPSPVHRLSRG